MLVVISKKVKKDMSTIAIDFDGVLHSYTSGWTGYQPCDAPNDGAQEFINDIISMGHKVIIFSSRASTKIGKKGIEDWLDKHDFPILEITDKKPEAVLYVDDRGFRFEGDFSKVVDFVKNKGFDKKKE